MTKLDAEGMEAKLDSRVPLSGQEYREILQKMNDLLIDTNAHLESGNRHYNYLFEKTLCVNFNSIVYKQYDKLVCQYFAKKSGTRIDLVFCTGFRFPRKFVPFYYGLANVICLLAVAIFCYHLLLLRQL